MIGIRWGAVGSQPAVTGARSINFTGGAGPSTANVGISGTIDFSLGIWFKIPSGATSRQDLCGWGAVGTNTTIALICNLLGDGDFFVATGGVNANTSTGVVSKDTWHRALVTYDSGVAHLLTLYLDGVSAATANVVLLLNDGKFYFGNDDPSVSGTPWVGKATRPKVWGRTLTSGEAVTDAAGGAVSGANLLFDWPTTEGTGSTIADSVASNTITLSGSYAWSTDVP